MAARDTSNVMSGPSCMRISHISLLLCLELVTPTHLCMLTHHDRAVAYAEPLFADECLNPETAQRRRSELLARVQDRSAKGPLYVATICSQYLKARKEAFSWFAFGRSSLPCIQHRAGAFDATTIDARLRAVAGACALWTELPRGDERARPSCGPAREYDPPAARHASWCPVAMLMTSLETLAECDIVGWFDSDVAPRAGAPAILAQPEVARFVRDPHAHVFVARAHNGQWPRGSAMDTGRNNLNNTQMNLGFMLMKNVAMSAAMVRRWWCAPLQRDPPALGELGEPLSIYLWDHVKAQRVFEDAIYKDARYASHVRLAAAARAYTGLSPRPLADQIAEFSMREEEQRGLDIVRGVFAWHYLLKGSGAHLVHALANLRRIQEYWGNRSLSLSLPGGNCASAAEPDDRAPSREPTLVVTVVSLFSTASFLVAYRQG